jgi:hypothetical protein
MRKKTPGYQNTEVGIAWYEPEQWPRLLEISANGAELEETHPEWLRDVERAIKELNRNGIQCVKVTVDLEQLLAWCQSQNIPVNGEARSRYVAEKLQREAQARDE